MFSGIVRKATLSVFALFFISTQMLKAYTLFSGGRSQYSIVVAPAASVSERAAAYELQDYLKQIGGAALPVVNTSSTTKSHIYVGYSDKVKSLTGLEEPAAADQGFSYRNYGADIVILGGSRRGTMYGVFTFLERELGVRWYAPDYTKIPRRRKWDFTSLNHSDRPALNYRHVQYYKFETNAAWRIHNRLNMPWDRPTERYGGNEGYWGIHSFNYFVPSATYFKTHPEYFAYRDGKRQSGYAQLCLSNPDVLNLCIAGLRKVMREKPQYAIYDLSQNDNGSYCECSKCKALAKKYGGQSGVMLWFVNQAADALKKEFPDKYIGTFAYQYTRQCPTTDNIRPHDNVVVRLCDIECCFGHPLTYGCERNAAFVKDYRAWSRIADHIFIWDYVVDFNQYQAPFPNFAVLAPNLRFFRDNHAIGVMEEGQYQCPCSEFDDLRSWVLAQLMWNPEQDTETLVRQFISDYYGKAAPVVQEYFDMVQGLINDSTHPSIGIAQWDPMYTADFVDVKAPKLFERMLKAASGEDSTIRNRVDKVWMQYLYLRSVRDKKLTRSNGWWDAYKRLSRKFGARAAERAGRDPEEFIKYMESDLKQ